MLNDEMIANSIERILIQAGGVGLLKPFVEFEIEDLKPQRLRRANVLRASSQSSHVVNRRTHHQTECFERCFHRGHF